jgi:uncharacterized protein with HEPN domain
MLNKDITIVSLMIETIEKIFRYTSDLKNADEFESDMESFDAKMMNFIALWECIAKISNSYRDQNQQIEWGKIYAYRNVISQVYLESYLKKHGKL